MTQPRPLGPRFKSERDFEVWMAAAIKLQQHDRPCECDEPLKPIGMDNPNTPRQYRELFAKHCARCLGRTEGPYDFDEERPETDDRAAFRRWARGRRN